MLAVAFIQPSIRWSISISVPDRCQTSVPSALTDGSHYSHCQTQPAKSGGLGGRVGCGGRLTRTVGAVTRGGRGGRCCFGTWFQGMAKPPLVTLFLVDCSTVCGIVPAGHGKAIERGRRGVCLVHYRPPTKTLSLEVKTHFPLAMHQHSGHP